MSKLGSLRNPFATEKQLFSEIVISNYIAEKIAQAKNEALQVGLDFDFNSEESFESLAEKESDRIASKFIYQKTEINNTPGSIKASIFQNTAIKSTLIEYKIEFTGNEDNFKFIPEFETTGYAKPIYSIENLLIQNSDTNHSKTGIRGYIVFFYNTNLYTTEIPEFSIYRAKSFAQSVCALISKVLPILEKQLTTLPDIIKKETRNILINRLKEMQTLHSTEKRLSF